MLQTLHAVDVEALELVQHVLDDVRVGYQEEHAEGLQDSTCLVESRRGSSCYLLLSAFKAYLLHLSTLFGAFAAADIEAPIDFSEGKEPKGQDREE